jgi:hypothetical protein
VDALQATVVGFDSPSLHHKLEAEMPGDADEPGDAPKDKAGDFDLYQQESSRLQAALMNCADVDIPDTQAAIRNIHRMIRERDIPTFHFSENPFQGPSE